MTLVMAMDRQALAGVAPRSSRPATWLSPFVLLLAIAGYGTAAVVMGVDGSYDLRNYHYYAGWALFHKPIGFDLAPAQIQTYHHPLLDWILYLAISALNDYPRLFTVVWSIPQAAAAWLAYLVAQQVLAATSAAGTTLTALALAAAAIGATGAMTVSVVGTSMSEGVPNLLVFAAIWLALAAYRDEQPARRDLTWRFAAAGLAAGAAVGLKLTMAPYLLAFGVATLLTPGFTPRRRAIALAALVAGAAASLLAIGLPWWITVYRAFGNPLFPYYNAIFHSPLYGNWNFVYERSFPRNVWQWAFYPLYWTLRKSAVASEVPVRDARILAELVAALVIIAFAARNRAAKPALWCACFALSAYPAWLVQFSILRYASGLETLSGVVIVTGLATLLGNMRAVAPMAWAAALILLATTTIPDYYRRKNPGPNVIAVSAPQLAPGSLVLFLVDTPASYVAAFEPTAVRFVGLNNSVLRLESTFGLQDLVIDAIRTAPGEIWGINKTDGFGHNAEDSLLRYRLHRTGDCRPIESDLDTHLRICRLERDD